MYDVPISEYYFDESWQSKCVNGMSFCKSISDSLTIYNIYIH